MPKHVYKKEQSSRQIKTNQTENSKNHNQRTPYSDGQKFQEDKIKAIRKLRTQVLANFPTTDAMQLMKNNTEVEEHREENSSIQDIEMSDRGDEIQHEQQMEIVSEGNDGERKNSSPKQAEDHTKKAKSGKGQSVVSYIEYNEDDFEEDNESNVCITEIIIGGRTPSPFTGTMGAHSTAWIAHIDAVRRHLIGYHLDQAIGYLIDFAKPVLNSPLLKLKGSLDDKHQEKLIEAEATLKKTIELIEPFKQSGNIRSNTRPIIEQHLRNLIKDFLTFTNYLPLSTVEGGDTGGHAEGGARKFLNLFEYGNSLNEKIAVANNSQSIEYFENKLKEIKNETKIDFKNLETPKVKEKVLGKLWDLFAVDTPGVFTELNIEDKDSLYRVWALALNNFLTTIRLAYPYAYEFVQMHDTEVFKDSLILKLETQKDVSMLSKEYTITKADVNKIFKLLLNESFIESPFKESEPVTYAVGPSDGETKKPGGFICYFLLEEDTIGDVVIQGRTEKVFKSQGEGAHSIAWIALTDSIRRALMNKTLDDAFNKMKELATEAIESPTASNEMLELAEEYQQILFENAKENLENEIDFSVEYYVQQSNAEKQRILGQYVKHYFEFVNSTLLATVAITDTTGHAEGHFRQILINFEENGDSSIPKGKQKKPILQEALLRMYDAKAISEFSPDADYKGSLTENSDELTIKKWAYSLSALLQTLERAYPKSFRNADFKNYLINEVIQPTPSQSDQANEYEEFDSKEKKSSNIEELRDITKKKEVIALLESLPRLRRKRRQSQFSNEYDRIEKRRFVE